ncbi:hypothetical protein H1C71_010854 [Ictidomys tridecemlineatus]|nr:hypothetical protein H1C71_010854 [Ictidomys tridecemlineatus]
MFCLGVSKIPNKNNLEERKFVWGPQFQRFQSTDSRLNCSRNKAKQHFVGKGPAKQSFSVYGEVRKQSGGVGRAVRSHGGRHTLVTHLLVTHLLQLCPTACSYYPLSPLKLGQTDQIPVHII